MRRERPGREARRVVGVKEGKSLRDRVNEGGTVKFEKACPVLEETEEEDGHRFIPNGPCLLEILITWANLGYNLV